MTKLSNDVLYLFPTMSRLNFKKNIHHLKGAWDINQCPRVYNIILLVVD